MYTTKININNSICGILTLPFLSGKSPVALFLHGFASDKNEVNNIYQYMSEQLAHDGIASLRIDFRCCGESTGNMENSTIEKMVDDVISSIDYLSQHPNIDATNISIIGFSLGAAIGALATNKISCKSLILISPALHLISDFIMFLGEQVVKKIKETKGIVEIDLPWKKIKLSNDFYLSLERNTPDEYIKSFKGYLHCVAGNSDFSSANAKEIYKIANTENKSLTIIDDANHIFSLSDGRNILQPVADDVISDLSNRLTNKKVMRCRL